ncbi:hypothetical protein SCLARK_00560 [Spiroplasma clarkii]|nr:hypothetical protein SCLARK_00560 [Spiroplasma clarkii]
MNYLTNILEQAKKTIEFHWENYKVVKRNLSKVSELPLFEKNLIFAKNLYLFLVTRNNNGKEQQVLDITNFLKTALKEFIREQTSLYPDELLDELFTPDTVSTKTSKKQTMDFITIVDMFIDPSSLQNKVNSDFELTDNIIKGMNDVGDVIFGELGKLQGLVKNVKANSDQIKKINYEYSYNKLKLKKFDSDEEKKRLSRNLKNVIKKLKLMKKLVK